MDVSLKMELATSQLSMRIVLARLPFLVSISFDAIFLAFVLAPTAVLGVADRYFTRFHIAHLITFNVFKKFELMLGSHLK